MKKITAMITSVCVIVSCGLCAMAADKEKGEPDVYVDGNRILFADQNAAIVNDRTLVPARGVFEAMGCTVVWNAEKRTVSVTSDTGVQEVIIAIDSDRMKVSRFKNIREREHNEVTLDVAAQIMNDRTMIPLRAVSEAFNCKVEWDEDNYSVVIETGDPILLEGYTYTAPEDDSLVQMSLSTDKTGALEAGEEFTVYIDVDNFPEESFLSAVVATFEFDSSKFSYIEGKSGLLNNESEEITADVSAENAQHEFGAKVNFVKINDENASTKSGHIFKCVFKSLNGESGDIKLGRTYDQRKGYGSYLQFTSVEGDHTTQTKYSGNQIVIGSAITIGE